MALLLPEAQQTTIGLRIDLIFFDLDEREHPRHYLWGTLPNGFPNFLKETTLSLRFDLNEFWLLKLEAHAMRGHYLQGPSNDGTFHDNWFLYAAKVTFNF